MTRLRIDREDAFRLSLRLSPTFCFVFVFKLLGFILAVRRIAVDQPQQSYKLETNKGGGKRIIGTAAS